MSASTGCARGRSDGRVGEGGERHHFLNGSDAGDGLLGKREAQSDGAEQLSIDIHRAAAHALHDAGLGKRPTTQLGEDNGLLWSEILENPEDFDLEVFDAIPFEDSAADAMESGADISEWEEVLS